MDLSDNDNRVLQERINGFSIENYCLKDVKISNLELKNQERLILIIDPISIDDKKTVHMIDKFLKKLTL
ncbi:hypothetical protein GCM10007870_13220 [Gluconobacter kondonii]|uniref:Uncharacterized protein n=1 Tax=Gluconobacter kondonii TaxID=941463 RepID=A0ABQ5WQD3_9PROT|nr:hypothetical protein AA3266_1815 [Gluconobacter kondonii NBRC 3266]GLQ65738.1 hypothetical protein GCM10007870_13220 [Gluconobacter kondonii]